MLLVRPAKASTNTAVVQVVVVFRRTVLHCQGVSLFHEAVGLEDLDQREKLKKIDNTRQLPAYLAHLGPCGSGWGPQRTACLW